MGKKIQNILLIVFIIFFLGTGLARTLFAPVDINYYESRYAYKIAPASAESILNRSFQDSFENALSDQVPFSSYMKKAYNFFTGNSRRALLQPFLKSHPNQYVSFMDTLIFGSDRLVGAPKVFENVKPELDEKISSLNASFKRHPDVDFYFYYVEKDADMQFDTGQKLGAREYLMDNLQLPKENMGFFCLDSFDELREKFYSTDHHWNYKGSYEAYTDLVELLGCSDAALLPQDEVLICDNYSGTRGIPSGHAFTEPFYAYRFDFPPCRISSAGEEVSYGTQDECFAQKPDSISYGDFYGGDSLEIVFDTGRTERENILVLGDSYDNAILRLLSSHFNKTYSLDLRYYSSFKDDASAFGEYLENNRIDKVLLIGGIDYYSSDDFILEK